MLLGDTEVTMFSKFTSLIRHNKINSLEEMEISVCVRVCVLAGRKLVSDGVSEFVS